MCLAQSYLDVNFAQGGKFSYSNADYSEAVDLLPYNDTLLVLAYRAEVDNLSNYDSDVVLLKLTPDGNLITTFGDSGQIAFDFANMDFSSPAEMLLDGDKIIILGHGREFNKQGQSFYLTRFSLNGNLDTSFGDNGCINLDFYGISEVSYALAKNKKGELFVGGLSKDSSNINSPVVAKLNANYELDSTFGGTGKLIVEYLNGANALKNSERHLSEGLIRDILILDDGSILLAGGDDENNMIVKLLVDGSLDLGFNNSGYLSVDLDVNSVNRINRLQRLSDGDVIFGAVEHALGFPVERDFMVGRLNPQNGSYSMEKIDFLNQEDKIGDVFITTDESVIAVGNSMLESNAWQTNHISDFMTISVIDNTNNLENNKIFLIPYNTGFQCGLNTVVEQSNGRLVAAGFSETMTGRELAIIGLDRAKLVTAVSEKSLIDETESWHINLLDDSHIVIKGNFDNATIQLFDLQGRELAIHKNVKNGQLLPLNFKSDVFIVTATTPTSAYSTILKK